jgi:hypothetical protein
MQGTDRGAVGAFGPLKPTLADERLDFAVAQLDGHTDQLGGASATGKALPLGGQTARQDVRSSRLRDSGQVVVHFLQSTHRRAFLRPPRREGFVRVLRGTKQTVSVRHRERMLILVARDIVAVGDLSDVSDRPIRGPFYLLFFLLKKLPSIPRRARRAKGQSRKVTDISVPQQAA